MVRRYPLSACLPVPFVLNRGEDAPLLQASSALRVPEVIRDTVEEYPSASDVQ